MELSDERKNRYNSRIGYIIEKMHTLPDNIAALDEIGIDGVLYRVQTSIDAAMDLAAMLVRDIGIDVGDDYENVDTLRKKKIIDAGLAEEIKRLNGMRNAIVHKYESVDTELVLQNLQSIKETLQRFIEAIESEIS